MAETPDPAVNVTTDDAQVRIRAVEAEQTAQAVAGATASYLAENTAARLSAVEAAQAAQDVRLNNHDSVLAAINANLEKLIERVDKFDRRILVLIAVLAASSPAAAQIVSKLAT